MIKPKPQGNGVNGMVTVRDAAKRVGVSPRRLHQLIESRGIATERLQLGSASVILLRPADVERLANEDRRPGRPTKKT